VFHTIARAGGPTERGSFRNIEVRRGGGVVRRIDLYDYLLRGDATADVRTEQGDVIFVPLNARAVAIKGAVRRPAIFELRDGEGFSKALEFAGGLLPTASVQRLQVDRTLPPSQRSPGKDRVLLDVSLRSALASTDSVGLYDNDILTVFSIGELRRNSVELRGEVFQPGTYEWSPGMTLEQLVAKAQGFLPWALTDRIKLERVLVHTGRSEMMSLNYGDTSTRRLTIEEFDAITVLDGRRAYPSGTVEVVGAVYSPGRQPYIERQTLRDVIDLADGFAPWALTDQIKVMRRDPASGKSELLSVNMGLPNASAFAIQAYDVITVLDARTANPAGTVQISGAVVRPGTRPFAQGMTVADLIALAGGLTESAAALEIARRRVGTAYADTSAITYSFAVSGTSPLPDTLVRFTLHRDDEVIVRQAPGYRQTQTVQLSGLFMYPGEYAIRHDGERLSAIIARAGGVLPTAYAPTFRLLRQGKTVAVDFASAVKRDKRHDIVMVAGDQLRIGPNPSLVLLNGEVERQVAVPFQRGWNLDDYLNAAGGLTDKGDRNRVVVEYASGAISRTQKQLRLFRVDPDIKPGSIITVVARTDSKENKWGPILTTTLQVTTTVVSLIIGYLAVTKN
jgi:polysaccharide biosynthesis/export protein